MLRAMRSTVRIDDDLLEALKARARKDGTSLTRTLNVVLRQGLRASNESRAKRFEQRTVSLGGTETMSSASQPSTIPHASSAVNGVAKARRFVVMRRNPASTTHGRPTPSEPSSNRCQYGKTTAWCADSSSTA